MWFSNSIISRGEAQWENWETVQSTHRQIFLSSWLAAEAVLDAGEFRLKFSPWMKLWMKPCSLGALFHSSGKGYDPISTTVLHAKRVNGKAS